MLAHRHIRILLTVSALFVAAILGKILWDQYMHGAWTRDGRIKADIVNIAPDISGQVAEVAVKDNQLVHKGDVLFRIDATRYKLALAQAEAAMAVHAADAASATPDHHFGSAQALAREAKAELDVMRLNLSHTEVRSPVDGYITNLRVHAGDYAQTGHAALAIVDALSFSVYGYFEETRIPSVHINDRVKITLMSNGQTLDGHVESIARAISDRDNPTGSDLLANVNPTFSWVRLAQRIPVRIQIDQVPDGVLLSAGMTCSLQVQAANPSP